MNRLTRLSDERRWEARWNKPKKNPNIKFDPTQPMFYETHKVIRQYIAKEKGGGATFLEVGAYPGTFLWYFYSYYGLEPWGVEYVESCAVKAEEFLKNAGVPSRIIHSDFFDLNASEYVSDGGWDVVASFGFVEHFDQPEIALEKHLEVLKNDGFVIISVPNHAGWNGIMMRVLDKAKWEEHNKMSLQDMKRAFIKAGNNEILFAAYVGHIGFWNAGLYPKIKEKAGRFYPILRFPFWLIERVGGWIICNNRITSPNILVIARKTTELKP